MLTAWGYGVCWAPGLVAGQGTRAMVADAVDPVDEVDGKSLGCRLRAQFSRDYLYRGAIMYNPARSGL